MKLMELAKRAAHQAKRAGVNDARVKVSRSRRVAVEWRDGKLDRIRESTKQSLSMSLYVNGRYSGNSTSDLRDGAIERYIRDWVAATGYLARDDHRHLPDPSRYQGMIREDLGLLDRSMSARTPETRLALARDLEDAARAGKGSDKIISASSWANDAESETVCLCTNGLEAEEQGSSASQGVGVSVKDEDDRKPRGWAWGSARFLEDLPDAQTLGKDALERALAELGTRQVPTGRYELVIENRACPRFLSHLQRPLRGAAINQKRSFFEGKQGQQIGSSLLTITDDPHLVRGLGSTAWDSEGMATRRRPVFDKGVLKTFYFDTYYASKQGVEPTSGSTSNLVWEPGTRDAAAMIKAIDEGIFVTSFLGGNSNATTGDFSVGIRGFYVKAGRIVHPVSEMNMAGNHLEFWKSLTEVGSDPYPYSSTRAPSLRFSDVQCSGA